MATVRPPPKLSRRPPRSRGKHPGGRPTDYHPGYGEQLIEHCRDGLSFESFAGLIGISSKTLWAWAQEHEEFSRAKGVAYAQSRLWWERVGIQIVLGKGAKKMSAPTWIYTMKCRFPDEWRERVISEQVPGGTLLNDAERAYVAAREKGEPLK